MKTTHSTGLDIGARTDLLHRDGDAELGSLRKALTFSSTVPSAL